MEAAKKNRTQAKRRFTRISNILVQTIESKLLVKTVENRYLELKDAWKNAQKTHEEYVSFLADGEEAEKWIIEFGEKFFVVEEKTDAYLESCYKNEKESKAETEAQL